MQLALEKLLKAHVCVKTQDHAPSILNLTRLAEIPSIQLDTRQFDILAETNTFNIEGRYPETSFPALAKEEAISYRNRAGSSFL